MRVQYARPKGPALMLSGNSASSLTMFVRWYQVPLGELSNFGTLQWPGEDEISELRLHLEIDSC